MTYNKSSFIYEIAYMLTEFTDVDLCAKISYEQAIRFECLMIKGYFNRENILNIRKNGFDVFYVYLMDDSDKTGTFSQKTLSLVSNIDRATAEIENFRQYGGKMKPEEKEEARTRCQKYCSLNFLLGLIKNDVDLICKIHERTSVNNSPKIKN